MRRNRRLEPYYHVDCNGDRDGCRWKLEGSDYQAVKEQATQHAAAWEHEVVIQNTNDGLVIDGRP